MAKKQKFPYLVGSKWTAKQKTWGWRHFQVINRKNQGRWVFAEIVASCDPQVRFWLNANQLKNNSLWEAGWKTLQEMNQPEEDGESDLALTEPQLVDPHKLGAIYGILVEMSKNQS